MEVSGGADRQYRILKTALSRANPPCRLFCREVAYTVPAPCEFQHCGGRMGHEFFFAKVDNNKIS